MSLLTLLICAYNAEEFLAECLDSVINQRVRNESVSVLIIDDGSNDNTASILKAYSTLMHLRTIQNKRNEGLVSSCNKGLANIFSPYFMRLDADDYLSRDAFEHIFAELKNSKDDFIVFNRYDLLDGKPKEMAISSDIYSWIASGVVFKTQSVKSIGGYRDEYWEEFDLYLRLLEAGCSYKISPHKIYYYRRGHKNMTSDEKRNKKGTESLVSRWQLDALNKYGDFNKILEYYGIKI